MVQRMQGYSRVYVSAASAVNDSSIGRALGYDGRAAVLHCCRLR